VAVPNLEGNVVEWLKWWLSPVCNGEESIVTACCKEGSLNMADVQTLSDYHMFHRLTQTKASPTLGEDGKLCLEDIEMLTDRVSLQQVLGQLSLERISRMNMHKMEETHGVPAVISESYLQLGLAHGRELHSLTSKLKQTLDDQTHTFFREILEPFSDVESYHKSLMRLHGHYAVMLQCLFMFVSGLPKQRTAFLNDVGSCLGWANASLRDILHCQKTGNTEIRCRKDCKDVVPLCRGMHPPHRGFGIESPIVLWDSWKS
jgi:hypothetical protein